MASSMRDLLKTISYGSLHLSVGFAVAYALTGQAELAAGIALIEPLANTVVFYFHEKVWKRSEPADLGPAPRPAQVA